MSDDAEIVTFELEESEVGEPFLMRYKLKKGDEGEYETIEEVFHPLKDPPVGALALYIQRMKTGDVLANVTDFLTAMIAPDDEQRWLALVSNKRVKLDTAVLGKVVKHVLGVATDRPTQQSSD